MGGEGGGEVAMRLSFVIASLPGRSWESGKGQKEFNATFCSFIKLLS